MRVMQVCVRIMTLRAYENNEQKQQKIYVYEI